MPTKSRTHINLLGVGLRVPGWFDRAPRESWDHIDCDDTRTYRTGGLSSNDRRKPAAFDMGHAAFNPFSEISLARAAYTCHACAYLVTMARIARR